MSAAQGNVGAECGGFGCMLVVLLLAMPTGRVGCRPRLVPFPACTSVNFCRSLAVPNESTMTSREHSSAKLSR
jgi:hypothetical protein